MSQSLWWLVNTHSVQKTVIEVEQEWSNQRNQHIKHLPLAINDAVYTVNNHNEKGNERKHCEKVEVHAVLFTERRKQIVGKTAHYSLLRKSIQKLSIFPLTFETYPQPIKQDQQEYEYEYEYKHQYHQRQRPSSPPLGSHRWSRMRTRLPYMFGDFNRMGHIEVRPQDVYILSTPTCQE